MRPHIKIATPCYGGLVTQLFMLSVVRLLQEGPALGFDVSLSLLGGRRSGLAGALHLGGRLHGRARGDPPSLY